MDHELDQMYCQLNIQIDMFHKMDFLKEKHVYKCINKNEIVKNIITILSTSVAWSLRKLLENTGCQNPGILYVMNVCNVM